MNRKEIIFIGAGGYAKSALDSLDQKKYKFCGFIDQFKCLGDTHLGFPILATSIDELKQKQNYHYFISIGNNKNRLTHYIKLKENQCDFINIIDKSAIISKDVQLQGSGIFIGKMAIINSGSTISQNSIINTKALIEHGCYIGKHCNISTNATLNGDVRVDDMTFVGSNATILGQLHLGEQSVVGAGAVVTRNIPPRTVAVGIPARIIKEIKT